ncbi:hypothetical protein PUNSTDRAFT_130431 [Punctularia strigosozonata HHB-11173 SS5]|uniref:uncharacterized protein n=1 Tax=Punctularia strigosozonata (strain HHB-11173) TaxID=741275 RepID=UPI0004416C8B|nr:uncharacterized protein PUNSTDRAFT_130431 [Punctularia strigosozonata HHB-11173 SS5]EIN12163.1 hypothetical protein PUNSTDRAFT_130431 [Punctularia strigosozonata HHB-11173 SS5]
MLSLQEREEPILWVSEPNFRGTFGIFSLCFSTLLISVWSAVHMDIPTYRPSIYRSFATSFLWMAAALFCPELLMFIAFNQRSNARSVLSHANKMMPVRDEATSPHKSSIKDIESVQQELDFVPQSHSSDETRRRRRNLFTLVHGFYASIGGYVFDVSGDEDDEDANDGHPSLILPAGRTRMTLTAQGVCFLMKHDPDLIPDIPETSITDRTQASALSKALLLAQVAWFCANCLSRITEHLPLSLLEVSTVAHGLCTLVTYLLWWSKPLNVVEPTLIRGSRAREACALMVMCSVEEYHMLYGVACIRFPAEMQFVKCLEQDASNNLMGQPDGSFSSSSPPSRLVFPQRVKVNLSEKQLCPKMLPLSLLPETSYLGNTNLAPKSLVMKRPGFFDLKSKMLYGSRPVPWHIRDRKEHEAITLESEDIQRWTLASAAMRNYGLISPPILDKPYVLPYSSLQSSTDFKGQGLSGIMRSNLSAAALALTYGVPHFLAWNARFPTAMERLLWRIATVVISSWGMGMALIVATIVVVRMTLGIYTGERRGETRLVACAAMPYITMSGYLLIESLRQLFFLEPAAYELPSWSNYWPHFA